MLFVVTPLVLLLSAWEPQAVEGAAGDAQKMVKIKRIVVEGTRLPHLSVIRLAQLQAGQEVNFLTVQTALQKVSKVGLIENIDFEYESVPDADTEVILRLRCRDFAPSAKAKIEIPNVAEDEVWKWLAGVDPLFTREMPPTEAAIRLYSFWIGKYFESHGQPDFQKTHAVIADASSSKGGAETDLLVFKPVKRRGVK
jgi:hypothetical protein